MEYIPTFCKPKLKPISIRIPFLILERLKKKARKNKMGYQTLIKMYIMKGLSINNDGIESERACTT